MFLIGLSVVGVRAGEIRKVRAGELTTNFLRPAILLQERLNVQEYMYVTNSRVHVPVTILFQEQRTENENVLELGKLVAEVNKDFNLSTTALLKRFYKHIQFTNSLN